MEDELWLTARKAAKLTGVSTVTVYSWVRRKHLKSRTSITEARGSSAISTSLGPRWPPGRRSSVYRSLLEY